MKRLLCLILFLSLRASAGIFPATNETDVTFSSASYDSLSPFPFWGPYLATAINNFYNQYTNRWLSWSGSGQSLLGDFQNNQFRLCAPFWNQMTVPVYDFTLVSENGGPTSNNIINWETNIFNAPPLFYNGTSISNMGIVFPTVVHFCVDGINDNAYADPNRNLDLSGAGLFVSSLYGTTPIDLWQLTWTNGLNNDTNHYFGFYPPPIGGGHPFASGHLSMALFTLLALGADTNIGSLTINFNGGSVSSTNHMTAIDVAQSGGTLTLTLHSDRMGPSWDVAGTILPSGEVITNDANNCFLLYPQLINAFNWTVRATNLTAGNYEASIDGNIIDVVSSSQLASTGLNLFTNTNPNNPFWIQRSAELATLRDLYGVDHITLQPTHTAGDPGVLGVGDLLNYQSQAGIWPSTQGSNFITAMFHVTTNLNAYWISSRNAALQTNHTLMLHLQTLSASPPQLPLF